MSNPSCLSELIDAQDEAIATIQRLAELGPAIDGNPELFPNCIELLSLIAQQASHLERLSTQLARCVLPGPQRVKETPRDPGACALPRAAPSNHVESRSIDARVDPISVSCLRAILDVLARITPGR
jgi:hypothetical protein